MDFSIQFNDKDDTVTLWAEDTIGGDTTQLVDKKGRMLTIPAREYIEKGAAAFSDKLKKLRGN